MGVPAFYRWLSEKYPKIIHDVLEERVTLIPGSETEREPFDATRPNPSGLECDNLYIDMNGIIHPCSHPENGPPPKSEEEMFQNVCLYVDRLFRTIRPRKLLYLAIDGVAPRAKMNQQRSRRFRAAQEARELKELESNILLAEQQEDENQNQNDQGAPEPKDPAANGSSVWDSNVITPGTPFMIKLATYLRFYIRKRLAQDKAWRNIKVILSDASIPGEGEHKIMAHVRLQRAQPGYNPNLVHVLHGLDADLIMLALATHEAQFYISREEVLFGRKSMEAQEQRQQESGYAEQQHIFNQAAAGAAMRLPENCNTGKPLQRISIPILRDYLAAEFATPCLDANLVPFRPNLERLIDDIVFLCFFVGNDFLPHLPSLDIRDGALDFLFNVYKRVLPSLGDYITKSGGHVNLSHVDVILQHVGSIEDFVFQMKHDNEQRLKQAKEMDKNRNNNNNNARQGRHHHHQQQQHQVRGRAAKILEQQQQQQQQQQAESAQSGDSGLAVALGGNRRGRAAQPKQQQQQQQMLAASLQPKKNMVGGAWAADDQDNLKAARAMKQSISTRTTTTTTNNDSANTHKDNENKEKRATTEENNTTTVVVDQPAPKKKKETKRQSSNDNIHAVTKRQKTTEIGKGVGIVRDAQEEFGQDENKEDDDDDDEKDDDDNDDDDDDEEETALEAARLLKIRNDAFKEKVKAAQQKKLDEFARNVVDNVRLHETGWKDRYYSDKCKADDVKHHGGREHLFRSYVVGLVWVMKYYYDGCPSWKWYFPFHYAPFASDLKNIERFQNDVRAMELAKPFAPVEQLMAVLPSDSAHAIPKAARWLMLDEESPIYDFYPRDVPVDPNGKAMPWLWVVLLPFIDEDRLLEALHPTMHRWTKEELLCNARGLDDGYLYVHESHALAAKLKAIVAPGKTAAKSSKMRLAGSATGGFFGSVRPPLQNEMIPIGGSSSSSSNSHADHADSWLDNSAKVPLPPLADTIEETAAVDGLFEDDIAVNKALCVAFSEPPKLPHKSVLLLGAKPLRSILTEEDKRIRRPRLGRGGSIANMGGGGPINPNAHLSGQGSMNISQYERDVAARTGRGHEMYQTGTRTWGAMEPTPKQRRSGGPQPPLPCPNPFLSRQQQHPHQRQEQWRPQQHQQQPQYAAENMNGYGGGYGGGGGQQRYPQRSQQHPPHWQQQQQDQPQQQQWHGQQQQQPWQPRSQQQQQQQQQPHHWNNNGSRSSNHYPTAAPPPRQQHGFSLAHPAGSYAGQPPPAQSSQREQQQQQQQRSRASADAMQNLRAQLSSTLRGQQRPAGGQGTSGNR